MSSTGKKEEIITKTVATKEYVEDKNKNLLQKEEPQKRKRFSKIEMNKAETVRIMPLIKKEEKSKSVSTREIFTNTITQPNEVTQIEAINIKAKKELKKEIIVPKVDKEKEKRDKERLEIEIERRVKERVEIEVRDYGKGIEDISLARTLTYTSKPETEHAGVGLNIMESLMDELLIESKENEGTKILMVKNIKKIKG